VKVSSTPQVIEKISAGIACVRARPTGMEILLVRKRYTYAYNKFVNGRYRSENNKEIISLLNQMTLEEKLDLMSLNFNQIWYRVWLSNSQKISCFYNAKSKFETTFVADKGVRLRKLLAASKIYGRLVWEIPKGRKKNRMESDIHCAIREFKEETRVTKRQIKIYPDSITYSYLSDKTKYTNIYYYALAIGNINPTIDMASRDQVSEIGEIAWMNLQEMKHSGTCERILPIVKRIFRFMKIHAR
jgi:8-oxo-dGTP pyrophosphatase MutT (NUDIX family)